MMLPFFLFTALVGFVTAGNAGWGEPCSQENNRLQLGTWQFWDECNSKTYCAANSTCAHKGCRRDDYPFGYNVGSDFAPKCPRGTFCPDEEDACMPQQPVDSPCQLNRDDQCQGPPDFKALAGKNELGLNVNGSVCINNVCMWANVTEGEPCAVENTPYIVYGVSRQETVDIVSRGNCRLGLYCDAQQHRCIAARRIGEECDADKECETFNCLSSGRCGAIPRKPSEVGVWVYVLVCVGIILGMFGTLFGLYWVHRSQREAERERRLQYWREQNMFHQSLTQLKETARSSIMSVRSSVSLMPGQSDSQQPILQHPVPRAPSSLRYQHIE
ncbi:hypothetical protein CYLTODRAFT_427872 [Cylindrobasidium torrendii FP15055 ss-10]|uniref:Uncharacterized protein n=1 Tax=Cylindrobasidium torrendii FP15055 ss-10 TaxID=1314674 RepID=A0A0D7BV78_9AGAR|nr:hypothetical protein CYLTODRAFT_427872 [Cylindrobasidium torrendii FP15055 ss-10]